MKFTSARSVLGSRHTSPGGGEPPPHFAPLSAPAGGWKTTMSPTLGSPKREPMRLTSTRWPISSVGTIDSDGIRYGFTRNAWMPSARPSATATMSTSSRRELEADEPDLSRATLLRVVVGRRGLGGLGLLDGGRLGRLGGLSRLGLRGLDLLDLLDRRDVGRVGERLLVDGVARHLAVRRRRDLGRGIVQQTSLDALLRPGVAALADAGALADPAAQVVELRAPHVAAGGDLDPLDLRRVHRERTLHADAEGLLADR